MKFCLTLMPVIFAASILCSKPATHKITDSKNEPWILTFGEQGGYTGRQTSHQILSNGVVLNLTKLPNRQFQQDTVKTLDQETIQKLHNQIVKDNLTNFKLLEKGSMVSFIHLTQDSITHKIQWKRNTQIPPQLKLLYHNLKVLVE